MESYAQGRVDDPRLHDAIEQLKRDFGNRIPNHLDLRRLARARSVDFAALFFADQLLSLERNSAVNRRFTMNVDRVLRGDAMVADPDSIVFVLVPGYDYEENGRMTGADLQAQVAILGTLGFRVEFVDVDPIGTVLECADVIEEALARLGGEQIVIAGPSSAGPSIHTALSRLGPGSGVRAWLNLGGTLHGVPLLDWFQKFPQRVVFDAVVWAQDWRPESFESLTTRVLRERFEALAIPEEIQVFNYVSMSLSGDISGRLRHSLLVMWRIPLQKKGLRHSSGHTRLFSHKLLQRNVLASHTNSERRKHPAAVLGHRDRNRVDAPTPLPPTTPPDRGLFDVDLRDVGP